ncbi:hypothetical protein [Frankia sp. AgB32]|uniref:hypothetical protein n=1 Tax=Frankia sp. AgB32 TaxID=631119 RepID=UPI00200C4753|nr:hypothetical protein [Frankia sp. AgB32]
MEEDTVPPVAMTASTASVIAPPCAARGGASTADATGEAALPHARALPARPMLRLVSTGQAGDEGPEAEVHGWGGPASCNCRECTMARHPAAMPRLTVVR